MPRKPLIRSEAFPYHVTARGNNRENFPGDPETQWQVFSLYAYEITILYKAQIHAFVLMPNHIHMLISTPEQDLGVVMQHFMRSVTKHLNRKTGRSGRIFGSRYHWCLISDSSYYSHALKYVYRNPVKAGLQNGVEAFPFSTLHGLLGQSPVPFPLYHPAGGLSGPIPDDCDALLHWLNQPFKNEYDLLIGKALKRSQFSPPKSGYQRTRQILKSSLL